MSEKLFKRPSLSYLLESGRIEEYIKLAYGEEWVKPICEDLGLVVEDPCDSDFIESISVEDTDHKE